MDTSNLPTKVDTYLVENYDFYNVTIYQMHITRLYYKVCVNHSDKIVFTTPIMNIPFGVEYLARKDILNLQFTEQDNAFFKSMKKLDYFMTNFTWDNELIKNLKNDNTKDTSKILKGKNYVTCLRQKKSDFYPIIRLHLKSKNETEFYKLVDGKKVLVNQDDIKGAKCKATFEIGMLWEKDKYFGFTFYLSSCEIL